MSENTGAADYISEVQKLDRGDRLDAKIAEVELKQTLPDGEFESVTGMLKQHLKSMPAQARHDIENTRTEGGRLALNDPDYLRQMGTTVLGPLPATPKEIDAELTSIRQQWATEAGRKAYDKSTVTQIRYRALVRARDNQPK